MGTGQFVFGVLIVVVTAALGVYYAWRQWQTLRRLRADPALPDEERQFQRNQAWRRLAGSVLMLIFAGLFVGWFFVDESVSRIERQGQQAVANHEPQPELDPAQRDFMRFSLGYVIVLLLLVMGFIGIAGYEIFAIRRYSVRHMRRIQDERRAMIASETARIRRERNGHA